MDDDDDNIKDITPKQALLAWCKVKIPRTFPTNNFNKDWNDGRAIACLVDAVAPGLFPECEKLDPSEALKNARQSMKTAEKWLGIPQVISPEDIMNPNVDALSVMTYVLYYLTAKLKPGANTDARKSDDPTAVDAKRKKIQQNTFTD
ncbi:unnamed protein product [Porites lobata]|uniref:Calponin-homology (CH) domain-containing protein n=1 Tax=Porites lobata TaxID=104759 RepID=A0ABN8MMR2_9CNID|nr:unnamed protein product [Porites lobata]